MEKTTFKRDKNGNLIAYRGGKKIGAMGGLGESTVTKKQTKKPPRKS